MLTLTIGGEPCDPNFCQIDKDGYSVNANAVLDETRHFVDLRYQMQSITPARYGGSVTVVVTLDAPADSISSAGPPLGTGSAVATVSASHTGVSVSMALTVGPNQIVGGDLLATWIPYVVPPPLVCTPPATGTYPDCGVCPATAPGTYPVCVPPVIPPPPKPCDYPIGAFPPNCSNPPPPPGPPACTSMTCQPPAPPVENVAPIPALSTLALVLLACVLTTAAGARIIGKRRQ